ncbi:MAG: amidohydrolase [Clostridia bacterium]|nr:amidohydrolase [Clostridia bacterium]
MDLLIKDAHIVTGIKGNMYYGVGNIGIDAGKIAYIGPETMPAQKVIEARDMIAMPGLFNAHTHTSMVLMRNFAADKNLEDWLVKSIFPIEGKLTAEYIHSASLLAAAEMIRSGTVGFLDMYYHVEETAEAVLEAGLRANISLGILTAGNNDRNYEAAKSHALAFHRNYHGAGNGLVKTSLEVHSVYLYDEDGLRESAEFAKKHDLMVHAHLHETKTEVVNSIDKYGFRPIEVFKKCGMLEVPVTAAHCVNMNDRDMEIAASNGVRPVHCPTSNMYLASGFADIPSMQKHGIAVALGTDGAASNNDLDMFGEMNLAGLIHKGHSGDATVMDAASVVEMATANGAATIGFEDSGRLYEGMNADIILIDTNSAHNTPMLNPVNALVYSTKGSDVDTVIVNGRILMQSKELKTIDEEKLRYTIKKIADMLY